MNSLTQQQWQDILLKIEEAFPLTRLHTWAQVKSKVHKMWRKFNQLKHEHGESDTGQCKWPWFEQCLMIWGKIAKACDTAGGMDNGVPIDLVGGSVQEPVNLEDTEEHDARPSPNRQVPPFAGNSSQPSRTPPTPRSAACKRVYCKKGVLFYHNISVFLTPNFKKVFIFENVLAKFGLCF
jgi:hypothetical protein